MEGMYTQRVQCWMYRDFGMALLQGFRTAKIIRAGRQAGSRLSLNGSPKKCTWILIPLMSGEERERPKQDPWRTGRPHRYRAHSLSPLYVSIGGDKDMGLFGGLVADSVIKMISG